MSKRAILYIIAVICTGAASLLYSALSWNVHDPLLFSGLLALAVCFSTMKITLPRMTGTMSGAFVPVLAGIALLSCGEAVGIACASGIVQSLWRARLRPTIAQTAFNGAALSLSALAAYRLSHYPGIGIVAAGVSGLLVLAVTADYLVNTLLVSAVLCLVEKKSLAGIFGNCNFWAAPYYFAGAVLLGSLVSAGLAQSWYVVIAASPIVWLLHDSYRQHVASMECR